MFIHFSNKYQLQIVGAGSGYTANQTGGSAISGSVTLTADQVPSHSHDVFGQTLPDRYTGLSGVGFFPVANYNGYMEWHSGRLTSFGGSQAHAHGTNLPPFYALAYVMKL